MRFKKTTLNLLMSSAIALACGTSAMAQIPVNDDCSGALDLSSSLGQPIGQIVTTGPYDNTNATTSNDPVIGWECFGEPDGSGSAPTLENTIWFMFTGDGGNYFITTDTCAGTSNPIEDGDTQFALYTGTCSAFTPVKCNEDGLLATATYYPAGLSIQTTAGTVYYLMVDGFNFNGSLSNGEFCIKVTQLVSFACGSVSLSPGTATASTAVLCFGDTLLVTDTGAIAPTEGTYNGIGMIISSADISGNTDPLTDPSLVATYAFVSPAPATYIRSLINNGTLIGGGNFGYGVYYWTPVVFGNAIELNPSPTFLSDLILDPSCTYTGTSVMVNVLAQGDPLCTASVTEINGVQYGIVSVYPQPVIDVLNLSYRAINNDAVIVTIYDVTGREVSSQKVMAIAGLNKISIDANTLAGGSYSLKVLSGNNQYVSKFVKQ